MRVFQVQDDWSMDNLVLAERPDPQPGPGELLLRMKAASLNYRDLLVPKRGYGRATGTLPLIPLSDGVGEVVAVGGDVGGEWIGQRVCPAFTQNWPAGPATKAKLGTSLGGPLDGVMADLMAVKAGGVVPVPEHLSDEQAATLPCAALTAWSALVAEGGLKAGDRVLVIGTGGVALFAVQFAKMHGAHVTVVSRSEAKLERVKALGADATLHAPSTPEWGQAAREIVGGDGIDMVVELGGEGTLPQSLRAVRTGGTIFLIGVVAGPAMHVPLGPIVTRFVRLQGISVASAETFAHMARAVGSQRLEPVVDRVFPFEELHEAMAYLASGDHFGKVCLRH